jgi:ribonuclease HII
MTGDVIDLLAFERPLLARGEIVVGLDEVGRGALAGPMTVGAVVLTTTGSPPVGLTDSKALSAHQRATLRPLIECWVAQWALGSVSAREIDEWGLRLALAVAATRAIDALDVSPTHALIDGSFNLLTAPSQLSLASEAPTLHYADMAHTTIVKGDRRSGVIAAASVLAKVGRDHVMDDLDGAFPGYGWASNKGYGTRAHMAAMRAAGPCVHHRQTWQIPIRDEDVDAVVVTS